MRININKNAGMGAMPIILGVAGVAIVAVLIFGVPEKVKNAFLNLRGKSDGLASISLFGQFEKNGEALTIDEVAQTIVADLMSVQKLAQNEPGEKLHGICFKNASSSIDFYDIVEEIEPKGNACEINHNTVISSVVTMPAETNFLDPEAGKYRNVTFLKNGGTIVNEDILIMIGSKIGSRVVTVTPAGVITYSNLAYDPSKMSAQTPTKTTIVRVVQSNNEEELKKLSDVAKGLANVMAGLEALKKSSGGTQQSQPNSYGNLPSPPQYPTIVRDPNSSFVVFWEKPYSEGGSPIIDYVIYRKASNTAKWEFVGSAKGDALSYSGMEKRHIPYVYQVAARNQHGQGPFSNDARVVSGN